MSLELLLMHADDSCPTLEEGLPLEAASDQPGPAASAMPEHLWDSGGNPNDLPAQRWGLVVPEGPTGDRLLALIEPLRRLRQEEQGAPVRVYRAPPNLDAPMAARWKNGVLHDESVPEADQPRYLLLLGDLDQLSLELQQVLGGDGFIGRLAFSRDEDYEAYADKVLHWTRNPSSTQARALFYTAHDGTGATTVGYRDLITPSLKTCRERLELGDFPAREILELGDHADWSVDRLLENAAAAEPSLLFSLSHGLGAPRQGWRSVDEQRALQGAMSLGSGPPLDASALASRPFLPGGLWFYLACFGAGTPSRSAFHTWLSQLRDAGQFSGRLDRLLASLPREGEKPFVAALPKAALANPQGPLAIVGHMDLAWTYSFQEPGKAMKNRPSRFMGLMRSMVSGRRAGVSLSALLRFFNEANVELTALYDQEAEARLQGRTLPANMAQRAHLWMLRQDVSGYVLLGDPAVNLPVSSEKAKPASLAVSVLSMPVASAPTLPATEAMAEAVLALLSGEESPKDIAARVGVPLKQLRSWEQVYKEAGQAALARLRASG
ncbi:helix-turn-helix domain-containing protein [Hyalangium versicolor]|uniref:helix-turn-helix domain-containing protein n=1 Tax=Hyalangium versicolor TaxID=2861190 RepID=UPI001CCF69FC|nr:helix-turn-helix domain-containing protein [Hyalangium versicolor]